MRGRDTRQNIVANRVISTFDDSGTLEQRRHTMSAWVLSLVTGLTILSSQPCWSQRGGSVYVRTIMVEPKGALPSISFTTIQNAWKENDVELSVELRTSLETLTNSWGVLTRSICVMRIDAWYSAMRHLLARMG